MGVALVGMSSAVDHGPHVALQVPTHRTRGCQLLRYISRLQLFNADFTAVRPRCANFCGIPHVELKGCMLFRLIAYQSLLLTQTGLGGSAYSITSPARTLPSIDQCSLGC